MFSLLFTDTDNTSIRTAASVSS